MRRLIGVALLLVFTTGAASAGCKNIHRYDRVVLYGNSEDPDVLLWDSRERMRDYEDGTFDQMNLLLPHARILPPGTRGIVDACVPDYFEPPYMRMAVDAIGIHIVSGPMRGSFGWVIATDIRAIYPALVKHGPGQF